MSVRGVSPDAERSAAIIVAAGSSTRMGGIKKEYRQFSVVDGEARSVLAASVIAFAASGAVGRVVVVTPPDGEAAARSALPSRLLESGAKPAVVFTAGGATRRQSVHNALKSLAGAGIEYVHIHDGARPWIEPALIARLDEAVRNCGAVIPVMPLVETPKEIDAEGVISRHLKRASIVSAQTPQTFALEGILDAHEKAAVKEAAEGVEFTDDAEVWGAFEGRVRTIAGQSTNKKITFPEDLPGTAP